ncbi:hypothetical protein ACPOL_1210 [Acidisarcina polymorpha]|uniref:Uncharacterized protein n=2 Tax=Acidisarcina polymorpha TaxID=2211140 RepID=A0A2Z5FUL2_9BACT|nr:hypothetical protein ACPOL_1210 [Acidisarcina polymorpha]
MPASISTSDLALAILAYDAAEGGSQIQGFFSVPAPKIPINPVAALNAYYTNVAGAYCTFYAYGVHPIAVRGLNAPVLTNRSAVADEHTGTAELPADWPRTAAQALKAAQRIGSVAVPLSALEERVARENEEKLPED